MDVFSKFTVSHFIWYLVPGLGAFVFIIFPLAIFAPFVVQSLLQVIGPMGLVLFCIILGFLMDGLRLYRLKFNYKKIKSDFFSELQNIVGKKIDPYLIQSNIIDMARKKEMTGVNLHHAIWILHGHFSILCFSESAGLLVYSLYILMFGKAKYTIFGSVETGCFTTGIICIVLMFLFSVAGARFMQISTEDQKTTNNMFLDFGRQYQEELKIMLNIKN